MNKNTRKIRYKQASIEKEFTSNNLTAYSGCLELQEFLVSHSIPSIFDKHFPTIRHSATKFSTTQILLSLTLASLCGTNRLCNIEHFTADPLIRTLLNLKNQVDEDTLSYRLKQLGESGARQLTEVLFKLYSKFLPTPPNGSMIIDIDSTVESTYGNQEGASKAYNPQKKGLKSYHPNIAFCSETKQILGSFFRCGNAYTSNGTIDLIKQVLAHLPTSFNQLLFRMDCGYFSNDILSFIEAQEKEYLVKVKLKGLRALLKEKEWETYNDKLAFCKFEYRCKSWDKTRTFIGVRRVKRKGETAFFNSHETIPFIEYEYCAICTSLDLEPDQIYRLYNKRGECENWIEQVKHQLYGCHTLTKNFWVNDILWQIATFAYNISLTFRMKAGRKFWKEEHRTFYNWFIAVPGKVIKTARTIILKQSKYYLFLLFSS